LLKPDENSIRNNDSITFKILFNKLHPDSETFQAALHRRNIIPVFWSSLNTGEYITLSFQYTKQLPLSISNEESARYGAMFHKYFTQSGKNAGDVVRDLTIQTFQMGLPPAIYNIGGVSVRWNAESEFSIDIDE
jgi:hypothetical protein